MTVSDWIISLGTGLLAIIIGVASYFAQKWIQAVDETLKEHSSDFKALTKQVSSLEQKQASQAENLSKTIHTQLAAIKFPHSKIDEINEEVGLIKHVVQDKILPKIEKQDEYFGKVILINNRLEQQETNLVKLFRVIESLVKKKS